MSPRRNLKTDPWRTTPSYYLSQSPSQRESFDPLSIQAPTLVDSNGVGTSPWFNPDGTKVIVRLDQFTLGAYDLSTPFDMSTATQTATKDMTQFQASTTDIEWSWVFDNGSRIATVEATLENVNVYNTSTPYALDFSSRESSNSLNSSFTTMCGNIYNGGSNFVLGGSEDSGDYFLIKFQMSTPFDPTTISKEQTIGFKVPSQTYQNASPSDFSFRAIYTDSIFEYGVYFLRRERDNTKIDLRATISKLSNPGDLSTQNLLDKDKSYPFSTPRRSHFLRDRRELQVGVNRFEV